MDIEQIDALLFKRQTISITFVLFAVLITGIILSTCYEEKNGQKVFNNAKASKILIGTSVPLIVITIFYWVYNTFLAWRM